MDPTWNEGRQLLWKGRLAKYAFRGIHVGLYPYGCLVPGQTLPNVTVSKGIADTPGEQILLSAFRVPGHATVEHPITFKIVDDETKQRQSSQLPPKFRGLGCPVRLLCVPANTDNDREAAGFLLSWSLYLLTLLIVHCIIRNAYLPTHVPRPRLNKRRAV